MAEAQLEGGFRRRLGNLREVYQREGLATAVASVWYWTAGRIWGWKRAYYFWVIMSGAWFDWTHGSDTGGVTSLEELGVDRTAGLFYMSASPQFFSQMERHLPVDRGAFTFVDLGCGKGRVLMMATGKGYRRVIGVDISSSLISAAIKNTRGSSELVCANVLEFKFPMEPLVIFIYNSFFEEVTAKVISNLEQSIASRPREVWILHLRPFVRGPLDHSDYFELYHENRVEPLVYCIYRNREPRVSAPARNENS